MDKSTLKKLEELKDLFKERRESLDLSVLEELREKQKVLMGNMPHGHVIPEHAVGRVVAGMGLIEEVLEYLGSIGFKSWRPDPLPEEDQLEELSDMLFYYLELIIFSGFTFEQLLAEYDRKWLVNISRYKKAKAGDYSWDDRGEKDGL